MGQSRNWRQARNNNPQSQQVDVQKYDQIRQQLILSNKPSIWAYTIQAFNLQQVRKLWLCHCVITDDRIADMVNLNWDNLQQLYISKHLFKLCQNQISDVGVKVLVNISWLNLKVLYIGRNIIGSEGFEAIVMSSKMPKMQHLSADKNIITPASFPNIKDCAIMNQLRYLDLSFNNIGQIQGTKIFIQCNFHLLEELWLNNCHLGDAGVKCIAKSNFHNLSKLRIGNDLTSSRANEIGLNGFQWLMNYELKQLKYLSVIHIQPISLIGLVAINCQKRPRRLFNTSNYQFGQQCDRILSTKLDAK